MTRLDVVRYVLVRDVGVDAPRVRKDGSEVTQGRGREQIWRSLWIMAQKGKRFTARELHVMSSTEEFPVTADEVWQFLKHLVLAGYAAKHGETFFMPVSRWTGPKPPQIQKSRQVWDPNTRQVVWRKEVAP